MREADPDLAVVTVHVDPPLSKRHRQLRVDACKWNLKKWKEDPTFFR